MRPACRSPAPADVHDLPLAEFDAKSRRPPAETVPAEAPGVFIEQPFERWSSLEVVVGLARLVRWTGATIARGVATP